MECYLTLFLDIPVPQYLLKEARSHLSTLIQDVMTDSRELERLKERRVGLEHPGSCIRRSEAVIGDKAFNWDIIECLLGGRDLFFCQVRYITRYDLP